MPSEQCHNNKLKVRQTHQHLVKVIGCMFHHQAFQLNQVIKTLRTLLGSH